MTLRKNISTNIYEITYNLRGRENFSTMYTYDRQANITRMKKYGLVEPLTGEYGVIDDLFLAYEGNQAVLVEDSMISRFFALVRTADRTSFYLACARQRRPTSAKNLDELASAWFGARRLPSHLPLWTAQDPCLEKYYPTSPYANCAGDGRRGRCRGVLGDWK